MNNPITNREYALAAAFFYAPQVTLHNIYLYVPGISNSRGNKYLSVLTNPVILSSKGDSNAADTKRSPSSRHLQGKVSSKEADVRLGILPGMAAESAIKWHLLDNRQGFSGPQREMQNRTQSIQPRLQKLYNILKQEGCPQNQSVSFAHPAGITDKFICDGTGFHTNKSTVYQAKA